MVVGLTGGLATGKSAVTRMLRDRGAITFSADEAARAILIPGGQVLHNIARNFGDEVLLANGELNRARLGQIIFADAAERDVLNRITHPAILRLLRAQIEATLWDFDWSLPVVVETPLLYETNLSAWFERIIVVTASESTQIARLNRRDGLDTAEARRRLAAQWPLEDKAARADWVIPNEGSPEELSRSVENLWRHLKQTAQAKANKKKYCFLPDIML